MVSLVERHDNDIVGVVSCFDRVIIHGTLPGFGHSDGMTSYLKANGIRNLGRRAVLTGLKLRELQAIAQPLLPELVKIARLRD